MNLLNPTVAKISLIFTPNNPKSQSIFHYISNGPARHRLTFAHHFLLLHWRLTSLLQQSQSQPLNQAVSYERTCQILSSTQPSKGGLSNDIPVGVYKQFETLEP